MAVRQDLVLVIHAFNAFHPPSSSIPFVGGFRLLLDHRQPGQNVQIFQRGGITFDLSARRDLF